MSGKKGLWISILKCFQIDSKNDNQIWNYLNLQCISWYIFFWIYTQVSVWRNVDNIWITCTYTDFVTKSHVKSFLFKTHIKIIDNIHEFKCVKKNFLFIFWAMDIQCICYIIDCKVKYVVKNFFFFSEMPSNNVSFIFEEVS